MREGLRDEELARRGEGSVRYRRLSCKVDSRHNRGWTGKPGRKRGQGKVVRWEWVRKEQRCTFSTRRNDSESRQM